MSREKGTTKKTKREQESGNRWTGHSFSMGTEREKEKEREREREKERERERERKREKQRNYVISSSNIVGPIFPHKQNPKMPCATCGQWVTREYIFWQTQSIEVDRPYNVHHVSPYRDFYNFPFQPDRMAWFFCQACRQLRDLPWNLMPAILSPEEIHARHITVCRLPDQCWCAEARSGNVIAIPGVQIPVQHNPIVYSIHTPPSQEPTSYLYTLIHAYEHKYIHSQRQT